MEKRLKYISNFIEEWCEDDEEELLRMWREEISRVPAYKKILV